MLQSHLKIALRNLLRNKTYTSINILGLSLSIACAVLIFSLIKYHLSFDNFHPDSERIYRFVTEKHRETVELDRSTPAPLGKVFRDDYSFAEKAARICTFEDVLISIEARNDHKRFKEEAGLAFTEPSFFEIFNFPLLQGNPKTFLQNPNSAILTQEMAEKYFGKENPIGKTFTLDNKLVFKVEGILKNLPQNSTRQTGIYVSYAALIKYNDWLGSEDSWGGISSEMQTFLRLRPGVSVAQVEKVLPPYVKKYRANNKNVHVYRLQPLRDIHFNADFDGVITKRTLNILGLIGLFLILTACVNFVNLGTAQALNRSREVGVRKALGSFKWQVLSQFVTETGLIALISLALGSLVAFVAMPLVNTVFGYEIQVDPLHDWQFWLFIPALFIGITLLAGFYPALVLANFQPIVALKGKLNQQHIGGFNLRRVLIVSQFVLAQVLIIGLIVIAKQMNFAQKSDLGFNRDAILMIPLGSWDEKIKTLQKQFLQVAGVEKVSVCANAPASQSNWNAGIVVGNKSEEEIFKVVDRAADEHYLETFGLELVAGRNIFPGDTVKEFVVNEMLATKLNLASPEELLGLQLTIAGNLKGPVVGVVKDFYNFSLHNEIEPIFISTNLGNWYQYAVKINPADIKNTLPKLEKLWAHLYPDQVYTYKFVDEQIAEFYETEASFFSLIQAFSLIAIIICCLGLYGLVSFMAIRKSKEIGIRKVLGSSIASILLLFGREFMLLIALSFVLATPLGWYLMNAWLEDFQYQIKIGPLTFGLALLAIVLVTLLTVGFQSIKAALMNPVKSLKSE